MPRKSRKRVSLPRRKACESCIVKKARCDLNQPSCSRCQERHLSCQYSSFRNSALVAPTTTSIQSLSHQSSSAQVYSSLRKPGLSTATFDVQIQPPQVEALFDDESPVLSTHVYLLSPLDVSRVRDRWLDFFIIPSKTVKDYSAKTVSLISQTLKSYVASWTRNISHLPPIIHPRQCELQMPEALSNCISLLRLCENAAPGSSVMVAATVHAQMAALVSAVMASPMDHTLGLEALQAYLMLAIRSYFSRADLPGIFVPSTIATLQELAAKVCSAGIVCAEELNCRTPRWDCWVIAEAKRRTVYTAYMLENVYNFDSGAPSYQGDELGLLPAPASKWLWRASHERAWKTEYDTWRQSWGSEPGLSLAELWPTDNSFRNDGAHDKDEILLPTRRRKRVEQWAEDLDECGMLLQAVCTSTYDTSFSQTICHK